MTKKLLSAILSIIFLFSIIPVFAQENVLVVGMELAYPPFETKDENGDPAGVSVDFSKDFAKYIGKDIRIENISWDGLLPALQTGLVDMVISSMTITAERGKVVDFSDPYAHAILGILANVNSPIESAEDLNKEGIKLALKIGSTGYLYASENFPYAEIIGLADESACVTEVVQGKADAFLYDQLTIYRNNKNNPDTTKAMFMPFKEVENWGVAVKKSNTELLTQLNYFIADYRDNGGFEKITEKYLAEEKAAFDELGFLWFFSSEDDK